MTDIELIRNVLRTPECVIGRMVFKDHPEQPFFILERPEVMIPAGHYEVRLTHSPKFGVLMPILCEVPGRSGIRIHPGNWPKDTEGCLIPGFQWQADGSVHLSTDAYKVIYELLARSAGPIWLTVKDAP